MSAGSRVQVTLCPDVKGSGLEAEAPYVVDIGAASDDGKVVAALYHEREGEREANRNCPSDRSGFLTRPQCR